MALAKSNVPEVIIASIIRVRRIGELGTRLAVTSNCRLRRNASYSDPRFLQEPHGVTSKMTAFFIVTAVRTSNIISDTYFMLISGLT
jgi:hypothetical protein